MKVFHPQPPSTYQSINQSINQSITTNKQTNKQSIMKTKVNDKCGGPCYAILSCVALESPAIFFQAEDIEPFINSDTAACHRSFATLEEATQWISTTPIPPKKYSRKRKASLIVDRAINVRQQQNNEAWEERFQELQRFTETDGDGDPNLALRKEYLQPKLTDFIRASRTQYMRDNNGKASSKGIADRKERYLRLLELGVKLQPENKTYTWPQQAQKWRDFQLEYLMVLLSEDSPDPLNAELARWQNHQIKEYVKMMRREQPYEMYPHRVDQLREWDFPFPNDIQPPKKKLKTFDERVQEFIEWKKANNGSHPPQSVPQLGEWVKEQRKEYRKKCKGQKSYMNDKKIEKLTAAGFLFEIRKNGKKEAAPEAEAQASTSSTETTTTSDQSSLPLLDDINGDVPETNGL
jgi:hypothetical protein